MRSFRDRMGNAWDLDLNVGVLLRIKSELGFNLLDKPETMPDDIENLVNILWVCVAPQLREKGITPEQFGESLDGGCMKAAVDTFMEELMDFFILLAPAKGAAMKIIWDRSRAQAGEVEKVFAQIAGSTSLDSPEPLA